MTVFLPTTLVLVSEQYSRGGALLLNAIAVVVLIVFFFSSRRRHTRCLSDWSSDVCSSDLSGIRHRPARMVPAEPQCRGGASGAGRRHGLVPETARREEGRGGGRLSAESAQ